MIRSKATFNKCSKISDTVWIHPRHGGHSTTHSDFSNPIQSRYAPDTAAILSLIQIQLSTSSSDTLQTRKSFCHFFRSQLQFRYTPDTEVILLLIQISTSDTVQICSRHGIHYVNHSDLFPSPKMLQTRKSSCYSFRIRYSYNSDTPQTRQLYPCSYRFRYSYSSDTLQTR